MNAPHYRPECIAEFYTETGNLVARGTNNPLTKGSMDEDVVSISTYRDMGADAPTFSIVLTNKKPWHRWVSANDLVNIYMRRPPEKLYKVFVGLVEDCRKKVVMAENSIQRVISITGRGVAKAFIQFDTGVVPEAEVATPSIGWLVGNDVRLGGYNAKDILTSIWDNLAKKFVNYKFSDGKALFDFLECSFIPKDNLIMMDDTAIVNWQGSLWYLIKEIAEVPFYESYWEMNFTTGNPHLYVRPTPFNKKDWDALPMETLLDDDVIMDETGRSDLETYTIFSVGAKSLFSSNDPYKTFGTLPLWYKPYGDKYGIRRLHVQSAYTATADEEDIESCASIMRTLQTDLYNWNIKNNSFYNGTIAVKGYNKYKVGTRLLVDSVEDNSKIEYYITSVKHDFVNYESWITELGITRGCEPLLRFDAPVGKGVEYEGLGLVKYDPASAKEAMLKNGSTKSGAINTSALTASGLDLAKKIVEGAKSMMNSVTYVESGFSVEEGRMDCSLYTQTVYKKYANIDIGRTTNDQVAKGKAVDKSALQLADLVLFQGTSSDYSYSTSHVGIYVGDGQFIHNSSGQGHPVISELDNSYYSQHYHSARRILVENAIGAKINKVLTGNLAGYGNYYAQMGEKYGIDPMIASAISMQETGGNSYGVRVQHNVGGIMDASSNWTKQKSYASLEEGIEAHVKNLAWHKSQGRVTPEQLKPSYCPDGAANDPSGLNQHWLPGVNKYIERMNNA